ncbi:tRNA (adenosine(37)-N6)-threonylcarbamoyltransferase complex ATPase subunit type 1 TsaE [Pontibaca salina]|uniref:tRNA threonylcarbamoyladenosine biosynthesis protein TsaE n=1 Tax=Pontibaca salina TaxID=2795731 RepID=A0A934HM70_9RHOB|nr:tRNA (adenosine(37)-N6)-threonylcarbamoyltransferase complex ATPase subunit type 1 TsaE [Pontibaca salina]MBI6629476.1 tRNA (adenosine(37)-N6)-threonylcarbamoyltransferase complex ATPase subunit type 1 TsaE [Pontibaca salina]
MTAFRTLTFHSPEETAIFATRLAPQLRAGDCLLLDGPVGAGKTHFARHLVQSLLTVPEDVPSPTYTLVQTYDTAAGPLWHADLYRLTASDEIEELGLIEAFDTAICIIEWPDRLGSLAPRNALCLRFGHDDNLPDTRHIELSWNHSGWADRIGAIADV